MRECDLIYNIQIENVFYIFISGNIKIYNIITNNLLCINIIIYTYYDVCITIIDNMQYLLME